MRPDLTAHFKGGPLDGQTRTIPIHGAPLEVFAVGSEVSIRPMKEGETRYVLGRVDDKKNIAHYYVPTS